jgi:PAS domain S-box-containing protein
VSDSTPSIDPTAVAALANERLVGVRRLHAVRIGGVSAFFALYLILGGALGMRAWQGNLRLFAIYWAVSLVLWAASRQNDRIASAAALGIALVDMPAVFFVQLATFPTSNTVTGVAGFTAGVYVFLVFLAALNLERWQIVLTSVSAAFWEGMLQHEAGVVSEAIVASAILMGLAGATSAFAGGRVLALLSRATSRGIDQQRAEHALAQTERSYRALIEGSPDTIGVVRDGVLVYANQALLEALGYASLSEVAGRKYGEFILGADRSETQVRLRVAATGTRARASEERLVKKSGSQITVETAALRVVFDGEPAVMVVGRDITERKKMESELQRAREAKIRNEKLAAVGQLAAGVAHDLRNPLSAVRNAFHWIQKRVAPSPLGEEPRVIQAIAIVDKELRACSGIVEELLDFARERPLNRQPTSLRALLGDAASIIRKPESTALAIQVGDNVPMLRLDPDQFRQVLVNLLQNAAEAMPDGGTVRASVQLAGELVVLEVIDEGVGIPEKNLEQIFEPLFTTRARGTGLGLAIVAAIVKRHGATIEVASKVGAGTTFTVRMPIAAG